MLRLKVPPVASVGGLRLLTYKVKFLSAIAEAAHEGLSGDQ